MSKLDQNWQHAILERFDRRENLSTEELYNRYFQEAGVSRDEVLECLQLLGSEYRVPAGVLRPEDKLEKLLSPVTANNPWQWLVYRTREGDSETEINYALGKRMRRFDTVQSWSHVEKFGDLMISDFIRAWCGLTPTGK